MTFLASVWATWRARNKVIFHRERFDEDKCFELCRYDLVWWVKVERGDLVPFVGNLVRNFGNIDILAEGKIRKVLWVWTTPCGVHIKINVDGSFLRN